MTAAVLLDHVSAYAAAVRRHLADLAPEQVEDLTDGLEADLAEALEDSRGPVATGEVPLGRAMPGPAGAVPSRTVASGTTGPAPDGASVIDLTRRFGPAAEYAAELRAAAGLAPRADVSIARPHPLRDHAARSVERLRARGAVLVAPLRASPAWGGLAWLAETARPLWWSLRGWLWYYVAASLLATVVGALPGNQLVPRSDGAWVLLVALVLLSISAGRGARPAHQGVRRLLVALNVLAILVAPSAVSSFRYEVEMRLQAGGQPVYVDNTVYVEPPAEDGVRVDGQLVSNLFVYDAEGNPLSEVQIFDDRGRPVRTTYDEGLSVWSLPGVAESWSFAPRTDVDGRVRWNVYPLLGAPYSEWRDAKDGTRELATGSSTRTPPRPFAKAPALRIPNGPQDTDTADTADTTTPDTATPDPATADPATPDSATPDPATAGAATAP